MAALFGKGVPCPPGSVALRTKPHNKFIQYITKPSGKGQALKNKAEIADVANKVKNALYKDSDVLIKLIVRATEELDRKKPKKRHKWDKEWSLKICTYKESGHGKPFARGESFVSKDTLFVPEGLSHKLRGPGLSKLSDRLDLTTSSRVPDGAIPIDTLLTSVDHIVVYNVGNKRKAFLEATTSDALKALIETYAKDNLGISDFKLPRKLCIVPNKGKGSNWTHLSYDSKATGDECVYTLNVGTIPSKASSPQGTVSAQGIVKPMMTCYPEGGFDTD
ncbi:MAG: hypothetical protein AAFP15_14275 [Bacteroidota bacterium]